MTIKNSIQASINMIRRGCLLKMSLSYVFVLWRLVTWKVACHIIAICRLLIVEVSLVFN